MAELELVKLHEDGTTLVLRSTDGAQHLLPISDDLRSLVSAAPRVRPVASRPKEGQSVRNAASVPAAKPGPTAKLAPNAKPVTTAASSETTGARLSPREIQVRLRAGEHAEDLANATGLDLARVRRFEWPILAERTHVIARSRANPVTNGEGGATLGELADARLRARGVAPDTASWHARRDGIAPWVVEVRFVAGERDRSARWTFDLRTGRLLALDDEARWLSQPDDPMAGDLLAGPVSWAKEPVGDPHLAVRPVESARLRSAHPAGRQGGHPATSPIAAVVEIDRWRSESGGTVPRKGESAQKVESAQVDNVPLNTGELFGVTPTGPIPTQGAGQGRKSEPRKNRKGRTSVPTWDEIVFGSKKD